jgi:putative peptidoglycan lipid II flippase
VIGTAAVQINVFVNTNFASAIVDPATGTVANGPVSWLNYAFRFMQFPIGVFGVAVATAALPQLSRSTARQDYDQFRQTLTHALALVFLLCIPSAVGLAILGHPIVSLIFEHGRFTAFDTAQTSNALAAYAIGLAGYAAVKVLSPAFYALGDARTPMLISLGSIAVNYSANYLMVKRFAMSVSGLDLGGGAGQFCFCCCSSCAKLWLISRAAVLCGKVLRICAATLVMAIAAARQTDWLEACR